MSIREIKIRTLYRAMHSPITVWRIGDMSTIYAGKLNPMKAEQNKIHILRRRCLGIYLLYKEHYVIKIL